MTGPNRRYFGPGHNKGNVAFGVPLVLWGLLFSSAGAGVLAQSDADQLAARYTEIARRLASGDFEKGCAEAERLRHENVRFFGVYNLLGMCALHAGKAPEAEKSFREALRLNPAFTPARHNLTSHLVQQGRSDEAAAELLAILKDEPNDVPALLALGKLELSRRRPAQALPFLQQASRDRPEDTEISLCLAAALSGSGDRKGAAALATSLIDKNRDPIVLISAGMLAVQNGNEQSGRAALAKALTQGEQAAGYILQSARRALAQDQAQLALVLLETLEPRMDASAEWNALKGEAEFAQRQPEKAFEHLRKAVDLSPRNPDYYMKLGELMIATHSDRAAAAVFETGLKNLPDSHLLHFGLAICYLAGSRNWNEAHQHLREAIRLEPRFEPALELLCHTAVEVKEWGRLRNDAEDLIRLNPRSAKGFYYWALAMQGVENQESGGAARLTQSLGAFDTALQLDPRFVDAWVEKGKLLVQVDKLQPAIAALEKAVALDPECEEAYFQLARLYKRVGNEAKSRDASAVHARLNRAKREESERWRGLFQVQETGRAASQLGERP